MPRLRVYADNAKGAPTQDVWVDIAPINSQAQERLGYPTQKPESLLERIVKASSNEGDIVLDPFCGCGTAVAVAQRLGRRWVGIDITHLAITLIKSRLRDAYGDGIAKTYQVEGEPVSLYDAIALAEDDRDKFQYWALGKVGARPATADQKKGADRGIDGWLTFHDDAGGGRSKHVVISVKSGKVDVSQVRDLKGVIGREKAEMGVFITLQEPTGPMKTEALSAGFYTTPWGTRHPRVQIITVADLFDGATISMPPWRDLRTFKKAPRAKATPKAEPTLPFGAEGD